MEPLTPPVKCIDAVVFMGTPDVVVIVLPEMGLHLLLHYLRSIRCAATNLGRNIRLNCFLCRNNESLFAVNVPSVLNSLIVAPAPPNATLPSCSSCRPLILNASAFRVATPVACSTVNRSPTLKLPSWSVEVKNTLPPPPSTCSSGDLPQ